MTHTADSHLAQIAAAADWIREHHAEPIRIEDLARRSAMSVTSFHRHFKAVTMLTPLEYRTRIRLQGEGEAGARGGPAGDLYIFLSVKPHEFYQRDGADLGTDRGCGGGPTGGRRTAALAT